MANIVILASCQRVTTWKVIRRVPIAGCIVPQNINMTQTSTNMVNVHRYLHSKASPPSSASLAPPPPPLSMTRRVTPVENNATRLPRTSIEALEALVPFIPTFFVQAETVAAAIPLHLQKLYEDTTFVFYMKRHKHYVDIRTNHGLSEIRLRRDFDHPKRGVADANYAPAGSTSGAGGAASSALRRPPRNSEAHLISLVIPMLPKEYTPIGEVLAEVTDLISRHPSFDPRLGITGWFELHPEYVQVTDGKLRTRPYRSAPGSLDDLDEETSPLPVVFARIMKVVDAAAEGKNYSVEADKLAAQVPLAQLYGLLTAAEKAEVKSSCRSFPRFLRLHGSTLVVRMSTLKAYRFRPEHETCADTLVNERLLSHSLSPDDPVLKIPAAMDDSTEAEWPVQGLYDALPLTQCARLDEILELVPTALRAGLPTEVSEVANLLQKHGEYFTVWKYPDDESIYIVKRAMLEIPPVHREEILRCVLPLIPQGGTELESILRRVPMPVQRFFHLKGIKHVLSEMQNHFCISGTKIIRLQ